jgi:purine-nucleoside phosphorylase
MRPANSLSSRMDYGLLDQTVEAVRAAWPAARPRAGLILGSGWGSVVDAFDVRATMGYDALPALGRTGVEGHAGTLAWCESAGVETFAFCGRRHVYEGEGWTPVAAPIYLLRALDAQAVLLTNAAGGIRADLAPGDLMLISDHINMLSSNPLIGPHHKAWGARFVDQSNVYDPALRDHFTSAAQASGLALKEGVYMAVAGPAYETPAEVRAYERLGADAVGMSTVPEATLANAAGMRVAGLSCIANPAAGIGHQPLSHADVAATTAAAVPGMKTLLAEAWPCFSSI